MIFDPAASTEGDDVGVVLHDDVPLDRAVEIWRHEVGIPRTNRAEREPFELRARWRSVTDELAPPNRSYRA